MTQILSTDFLAGDIVRVVKRVSSTLEINDEAVIDGIEWPSDDYPCGFVSVVGSRFTRSPDCFELVYRKPTREEVEQMRKENASLAEVTRNLDAAYLALAEFVNLFNPRVTEMSTSLEEDYCLVVARRQGTIDAAHKAIADLFGRVGGGGPANERRFSCW